MLENLFGSQVQFDILCVLFLASNVNGLSAAQIVEQTGKRQPNVAKELERLIQWGFVSIDTRGKQRLYFIQKDNPYISPLQSLFEIHEKQKKNYFPLVEEGNIAPVNILLIAQGFAQSTCSVDDGLSHGTPALDIFENDYFRHYVRRETWEALCQQGLSTLRERPEDVTAALYKQTILLGEEAQRLAEQWNNGSGKHARKKAREILTRLQDIVREQTRLNLIGILDLTNTHSDYCKTLLHKYVSKSHLSVPSLMEKLLQPPQKSWTQKLRLELLELSLKRSTQKIDVQSLEQKWSWLNFGYTGPGLSKEYFQEVLSELAKKSRKDLQEELQILQNYESCVAKQKRELFKTLAVAKNDQAFIEALSLLSFIKVYRKDIAFLCFQVTLQILNQYKGRFTQRQIFYLSPQEALELLDNRLGISPHELDARQARCGYILDNVQTQLIPQENIDREIEARIEKDKPSSTREPLNLLHGTTACLGKTGDWIRGTARIVNHADDMKKMRDGDVLISIATTPDILPAMKKAAAIVTDTGGITCHAAIVSRELNIPCLIGTRYATKTFRDGNQVVVCPRHGYVRFENVNRS